MGCCGKKLVETTKKIGTIAEGNIRLFIDRYFRLPSEQCEYARQRRQECRKCKDHTFLTKWQFAGWVIHNGGIVKFLKDINDLIDWPMLPKRDFKKREKLFCRVCKCWIPAKSMIKTEHCPLGKWQERE